MKKLLIGFSALALFAFSIASEATVGVKKVDNTEIKLSINANDDVYGFQCDVCSDVEFTEANTSVNHMYSNNDVRSSMSVHYAVRDDGCVRVVMFSLSGDAIVYSGNVEEVIEMQVDNSDVTLKNITIAGDDGKELRVNETVYEIALPTQSKLIGNYPNPFNPSTTIEFDLMDANAGLVNVVIYDLLGREVTSLYNGWLEAGFGHKFVWDASAVASGKYFAVISAPNGFTDTVKMTLLK